MPTVKGTEASLSYVQCFLYLVSSSIKVSIFHVTRLDTFGTDFAYILFKCTRTIFWIDHMLGHKTSLNKFKKIEVISGILSDHNIMKLKVNHKKKTEKHAET